jgi:CheY-like chemotaxis protein
VLVGEDNPPSQLALGALLERCGVSADFVSDGRAVVEAVRTGRYRLVLLDLMMPKMTGFEAAKEIRCLEYGTGRHTPIVAVTAIDPDLSRAACIEAGMDDFLAKPIEPERLHEQLARWLPRRSGDVPLEERRGPPETATPSMLKHLLKAYGAGAAAAILESFLVFTEKLLLRLEKAITAQDVAAAKYLAHELKCSSLTVNAQEMARLARLLERAARAKDWPGVLGTYRDLLAAYKRVTEGLHTPLRAIPLDESDLA